MHRRLFRSVFRVRRAGGKIVVKRRFRNREFYQLYFSVVAETAQMFQIFVRCGIRGDYDLLERMVFVDLFHLIHSAENLESVNLQPVQPRIVIHDPDYGFGKSSPIRTEKITDVNPAVQSAAVDHDALEHGRLLILQIQFAEQEAFSVVNEKTFKADQRQVQQSEKKTASDEAAQAYMFHGKHRVIAEVIKQCAGNGGADQNRQGKMPVIIQSRAKPVNPVYP